MAAKVESIEIVRQRLIDPFDVPDVQKNIMRMENEMRKLPEGTHPVEIEPVHYVAQGLYAREITIPKGTLLTGKIHLFEHINIISKGDISVMTEEGVKRIKAPATIISKPGIKRIGYAHEDTVWTTVHACNETDPEKAEDLLVVDTFEEFHRQIEEKPCHLLP